MLVKEHTLDARDVCGWSVPHPWGERRRSAIGNKPYSIHYSASRDNYPIALNQGIPQPEPYIYSRMINRAFHSSLAALAFCLLLASCSSEADLLEQPKLISASGERDTIFVERSKFWENKQQKASVDSIRQYFVFKPKAGETLYVLLENTGGVPLRRDTVTKVDTMYLEHYLRTPAKDTNLYLSIEYPDFRKAPTDVFLYIRDRDSVHKEVLFVAP